MKKGYENGNERTYREIMRMVCADYKMEEANFEDFMKMALPQLPAKMRKQLDKYFGIDGGVNHNEKIQKMIQKGKPLPESELQIHREGMRVLRKLGTIDYLMYFRQDVKELVRKIAKKTSGDVNSIVAAKWAMLYGTVIYGGPYFFCDRKGVKGFHELDEETQYSICMITLMEDEYKNIFKSMPDGELLIPVVKAWVEDLDVRDQVSVLEYFGLKVPKYLWEFEEDVEVIKNIFLLRQLKERIFANGPWATDGRLFLKEGILNQNIKEGFYEVFELMRNGAEIGRSNPEEYSFGTGKRLVEYYRVQGEGKAHNFPYIEEIMVAFRYWNDMTENDTEAS